MVYRTETLVLADEYREFAVANRASATEKRGDCGLLYRTWLYWPLFLSELTDHRKVVCCFRCDSFTFFLRSRRAVLHQAPVVFLLPTAAIVTASWLLLLFYTIVTGRTASAWRRQRSAGARIRCYRTATSGTTTTAKCCECACSVVGGRGGEVAAGLCERDTRTGVGSASRNVRTNRSRAGFGTRVNRWVSTDRFKQNMKNTNTPRSELTASVTYQ